MNFRENRTLHRRVMPKTEVQTYVRIEFKNLNFGQILFQLAVLNVALILYSVASIFVVCKVCIVAKRCVVEKKLLLAAYTSANHPPFVLQRCGIHDSVLNWFESYLTCCSFRVKCNKDFSSKHILVVFLEALLSVVYTFCHVYYSTQHSYLLIFSKPSPLCR